MKFKLLLLAKWKCISSIVYALPLVYHGVFNLCPEWQLLLRIASYFSQARQRLLRYMSSNLLAYKRLNLIYRNRRDHLHLLDGWAAWHLSIITDGLQDLGARRQINCATISPCNISFWSWRRTTRLLRRLWWLIEESRLEWVLLVELLIFKCGLVGFWALVVAHESFNCWHRIIGIVDIWLLQVHTCWIDRWNCHAFFSSLHHFICCLRFETQLYFVFHGLLFLHS